MKTVQHLMCGLCLVVACKRPLVSLDQKQCDETGACAPGYVCYSDARICVRESTADASAVETGDACEPFGSALPCSPAAQGCELGCRLCLGDQGWSACELPGSGNNPGDTGPVGNVGANGNTSASGDTSSTGNSGDTGSTSSTGATGSTSSTGATGSTSSTGATGGTSSTGATGPDPRVTDLTVISGFDAETRVSFAIPNGALACMVRRATAAFPASASDGTQVGSEFLVDVSNHVDASLTNGTQYFYSVFCRAGGSYQSVVVTEGENAARGTPIGLVGDLTLALGGTPQAPTVGYSFTLPAGAAACKVMRTDDNSTPTPSHGTQLGSEVTNDVSLSDNVTPGTTYHYAVFCRADATYRNASVSSGNHQTTTAPACVGTLSVAATTTAGQMCKAFAQNADVILMRLTLSSATCDSHLTGLTIDKHAAANINFNFVEETNAVQNLLNAGIVVDANGNGIIDNDEPRLDGSATHDGLFGSIAFALTSPLTISTSAPVRIFLAAHVANPLNTRGYIAATLGSAADVALSDAGFTKTLAGGIVHSDAHYVKPLACATSGPAEAKARSVYSLESATDGTAAVFTNADPDALALADYCTTNFPRCDADASETSNCFTDDDHGGSAAAGNSLRVRMDDNNPARFLRVDAAIKHGLPVCAMRLNMIGTKGVFDSDICTNELWTDSNGLKYHWLMRYTGAGAITGMTGPIDVTSLVKPIVNAARSTSPCPTQQVTHDLLPLYSAGSAGDPFIFRFFASPSTNLASNNSRQVNSVSEIWIEINEP